MLKKILRIHFLCVICLLWLGLANIVSLVSSLSPWIVAPIALVGTIVVPGILLALNLKISREHFSKFFVYSIGLGVASMMLLGMVLNFALPYFGIFHHPLAALPILTAIDMLVIVLSLRLYKTQDNATLVLANWRPNSTSLALGVLPLLFIVLSVLGSASLNAGGNGTLTFIMLLVIAVYVVVLIHLRESVQGWVYMTALYMISLSLLLMYSLRSAHILGWDINQEYQVFQATFQNLMWKMSYYPSLDYNACLSVTLLPTILKELTHISSEYIFKLVMQILFAFVPLVTYVFARQFLKREFAFLCAFLVVSQTWFYEQMPALIRQEIAFIFFALILLVIFDRSLTQKMRVWLFSIFIIGLVVSHYSTTYLWIALMIGTLVLEYILRFFISSFPRSQIRIRPMMLVLTLVLLFVWEVPVTNSLQAFRNFATNSETRSKVVETATPTGGIALTAEAVRALEIRSSSTIVNTVASTTTHQDSTLVEAAVKDADDTTARVLFQVSILVLLGLFPLVAFICIWIELRKGRTKEDYTFYLLTVVAIGLLVATVLIPYVRIYYNLSRLYLQMLLILAVLIVMGGDMSIKRVTRHTTMVLACVFSLMFCFFSGVFDPLIAQTPRITLSQPPSTSDSFYIYDTEIAGAVWLRENRNPTDLIQSDALANLRLQSYGNLNSDSLNIFPETIGVNSYVYLTHENSISGTAFYLYQNKLLKLRYPIDYLEKNKDLVYSAGDSIIYR